MYMCICICVYVHAYMCICVNVYMGICVYVYMRKCVYVYMRKCVYVYMCICANAYMCVCSLQKVLMTCRILLNLAMNSEDSVVFSFQMSRFPSPSVHLLTSWHRPFTSYRNHVVSVKDYLIMNEAWNIK